jgi:hypothetical protein
MATLIPDFIPGLNFDFVGLDEHHGSVPAMMTQYGQWHMQMFHFIFATICMYACLFSVDLIRNVLYGYYRSKPSAEESHRLAMMYNIPNHAIVKDKHYYDALEIICRWFKPKWPIHPVHFTDLRWYPWNTSTSAERPFTFMKSIREALERKYQAGLIPNRRFKFYNLYTEIFTHCRKIIHDVKNGLNVNPDHITLHVKGALLKIGSPLKIRTVFGVPKAVIFAEAMFLWPLFCHYLTVRHTPLLWNYESLNGGWCRLHSEWHADYSSCHPIFNLDWSQFDMYVYFSVWKDLFDMVKTYFCFCGRYCPTTLYPHARTNPQRLHNLWNWIWKCYTQMKIVTLLGFVFIRKYAGMPSGIFGTQFWDSLYNGLMIVTCLLALGYAVTDDMFIKLMGDDVLFGLLQSIPVEQWADFLDALRAEALWRFNAKLSVDKVHVSKDINGAKVLSYVNWNGWPVRDPEDLLAHLLYPKTLRDSAPRVMARAIGIYVASAGHPRLRPICEHLYTELAYQGFSPRKEDVKFIFDILIPEAPIDDVFFDHFPSQTEVWSRLSRPSFRDPARQAQYWNEEHFPLPAGQVFCCNDDSDESIALDMSQLHL